MVKIWWRIDVQSLLISSWQGILLLWFVYQLTLERKFHAPTSWCLFVYCSSHNSQLDWLHTTVHIAHRIQCNIDNSANSCRFIGLKWRDGRTVYVLVCSYSLELENLQARVKHFYFCGSTTWKQQVAVSGGKSIVPVTGKWRCVVWSAVYFMSYPFTTLWCHTGNIS